MLNSARIGVRVPAHAQSTLPRVRIIAITDRGREFMNTRACLGLLVLTALGSSFCTGTAFAAEYTSIVQDIAVDRPADVVWKKVGGYCDIATWLKVTCAYTSGSGELGTVRRIADRVDEVLVSKTLYSYTYTQPESPILYHGTLDVQPEGPRRSKIIYTLFYDQAPLATAEAKAADRDRRATRFAEALATMKTMAEGK
jgi:Polyketide cyclase / dehydrase and lipid transport